MARIDIMSLKPGDPEITVCAKWRADTFGVLDRSVEQEIRSLEALAADQTDQIALVAMCDGVPAGTCLLVRSEIDPNHQVTPWLAGLFVAPGSRRQGAGAALVHAIENEARRRGHRRLFLCTDDAADFYHRLGWRVIDHTWWKGFNTALMVRDL